MHKTEAYQIRMAKASPSMRRCVGTISSLDDVSAAVQCTTVNINAFTVPAGEKFSLDLLQGTTVNVLGDVSFGIKSWEGPLFDVRGNSITFNGNGKTWHGGGENYWDGLGSSGGVIKPCPMMTFSVSGTVSDVSVVNSPSRALSINAYNDPLVLSGITIDNSQGNYPNAKSNGRPAGRNTDGFDVSGNDIVIKESTVVNQDDCLAINKGGNIFFQDNHCEDGHGISIGSINSDTVVENIVFQGNTVVNSVQAFRIKTDQSATNSRVTNVTYSGNTATNCSSYGILITQSYPDSLGKPGNGVIISDVNFNQEPTDISVVSSAEMAAVNCGVGSCQTKWDWSELKVNGGKTGQVINSPDISGFEF